MSNTPPGTCDSCKGTGLAILPARYAVIPAIGNPGLPGWACGDRVTSIDVGPEFKYVLRTLRTGYVYLYYERHARGPKYWQCYTVVQDGSLLKQESLYAAQPYRGPSVDCALRSHLASNLHCLIIEQPVKAGTTWIAYSEHKWSEATVERYTRDSRLRNARMQTLQPAAMFRGAKHSLGAIADAEAIGGVLEYADTFNIHALPHEDNRDIAVFTGPVSLQESGEYRPEHLRQMSTRYPWHVRWGAAAATAEMMRRRTCDTQGRPGTPHVLALWDPIGIVHELNGFRNDAAGRVKQYGDERKLQIFTSNAIKGAREAIQKRTDAASVDHIKRVDALADPLEAIKTRARIQLRRDPKDAQALRDLQGVENERRRRGETREERERKFRDTQMAKSWDKYQVRLTPELSRFNRNWEDFLQAADQLIDLRTIALIRWLESAAFLDTLEDYHDECLADAIPFEDVVGEAISGIGSCESGRRKLKAWAEEARASVRGNLVWRVIAMNQREGVEEIDNAMAQAEEGVDIPLTEQSWAKSLTNIKWNKIGDLYKKALAFNNTNLRAAYSGGVMQEAPKHFGFLKVFAAAGDLILPKFVAKAVDSFISEKIVQTIFLGRAGAHMNAVLELAYSQAVRETSDRYELIRRMRAADAFAPVMEDEYGRLRPNSMVLTERWKKMASSADIPDGQGRFNSVKDARVAMVVAVLELFNVSKAGYDAAVQKDGKSLMVLGSSLAGLASAATDTYANVVKAALTEQNHTFQKLKFAGGIFSGMASILAAKITFDEIQRSFKEEKNLQGSLQIASLVLSATGAISNASASLSYCESWLLEISASQLAKRETMAAAARSAALAASRLAYRRALLIVVGLQLNLLVLGIEIGIWYFTDDDLQKWLETSCFGAQRNREKTLEDSLKEFQRAMYVVGLGNPPTTKKIAPPMHRHSLFYLGKP